MTEDDQIMENMKEVLKKTQSIKHKRVQKVKPSSENELELSEILKKQWKFSSPPGQVKVSSEANDSPKLNAFDMMMMAKKSEPLSQVPELNGVKKKRKYNRRSKPIKFGGESCNRLEQFIDKEDVEESLPQALNKVVVEVVDCLENGLCEETNTRKRIRSSDTSIVINGNKKRKTKAHIELLDSNENSLQTLSNEVPKIETDTSTYQSGRPRRSCAGNISYEFLISPEKTETVKTNGSSQKQSSRAKIEQPESIEIFCVDDSPEKQKKKMKLAPLFFKKLPKPTIDPIVKEARRNFLLSGLPEEMRSSIDKKKQFEEEILCNELIAFPLVSHVTQLHSDEIINIAKHLWQKSIVTIKSDDVDEKVICTNLLKSGAFTDCRENEVVAVECDSICPIELKPLTNVKVHVKLARESFEQFPTNRCFKQLYWKYKKSKEDEGYSLNDNSQYEMNTANLLFVDIFKPQSFEEFVVNTAPVKKLQNFMLTWNEKTTSDSETDGSGSWQSSKSNSNFVVLSGFHGSGKTSSVYAIAKQLNYQVIEINAGSRRSGKKMLQDLLEATQSHRVKDKSVKLLSTQDETESSQESNCEVSHGAKSIILIEDAELAFEADDGFVSTLQQLINISKRPVILTTNNRNCQHLQKFIRHNEILFHRPKSTNQIGKYLSLMCLAANYHINADEMERLYVLNGLDLRKTINEIEFFIRSGNSRTSSDSIKFNLRPQHEWSDEGHLDYSSKSLSTLCFDSSIVSSFVAKTDRRTNYCDASYQQRSLMDEMEEFFTENCIVAKTRDLAHGKKKIER